MLTFRFSWLVLIGSFVASLLVTGFVRILAHRLRLIDVPNNRSSHVVPTARGGGFSIVAVTLSALVAIWTLGPLSTFAFIGLAGAGAGIALIGFLDDRVGVSASLRFLIHVVAAVWFVAWCSNLLPHLDSSAPRSLQAAWTAGVFLGLVSAVNLFNFMDGIDGLGGSQGLFVGAVGCWLLRSADGHPDIGLLLGVVAAASAGFLVWNISPTRIFLGDVGSGFLGFILLALPLLGSAKTHVPVATWVILWGTFLVDASVTLLRRIARGERWYQAHRLHAYQRLARTWSSHLRVTAAYFAVNVLWLAPMSYWSVVKPEFAVVLMGVALAPLVIAVWLLGAGVPEGDSRVA